MKKWTVAILMAVAGSLSAAERPGAAFLSMGVGARAAALSSAYTGVADDTSALYWNPAGLAGLTHREGLLSYAASFSDQRHNFAGYAQPTQRGAFGLGAVYLGQGRLEGRGADRQKTGSFGAADTAFIVGAARRLSPGLSAGANLKLIRETIGSETAQGMALDLGATYRPPVRWLQTGAAVRNLGPGLSFAREKFALPATLTAGAAARLSNLGLASFDIDYKLVEKKAEAKAGFEWSPGSVFALRAGYASPLAGAGVGASGFVWGLGVAHGRYRLDYAMVPGEALGDTQQVSLRVGF